MKNIIYMLCTNELRDQMLESFWWIFLTVGSTRSVYRRKLERLSLEQSILSSAGATESPPKEGQVTRVRETDSISFDSKDEFDLELEEIPEGSLILEGNDSMDEDLIRGLEPGRRETGVQGPRSSNDASCDARETKFKDLEDICLAGRSPFETGDILSFIPPLLIS